jgi:hypothetical protein
VLLNYVELSRFNQPGEIENKIYTREGYNFYNHHDWKFRIHFEDDNEIHLIKEKKRQLTLCLLL